MKNKLFATVVAGLFSLGLFACKKKPEEAKAGEPTANEPAGGGGGDKIGVAICDEWMEKFARCIETKMPEADRQATMDALKESADTYRQAASTSEGRSRLEKACKQMIESSKEVTASFGCEW